MKRPAMIPLYIETAGAGLWAFILSALAALFFIGWAALDFVCWAWDKFILRRSAEQRWSASLSQD